MLACLPFPFTHLLDPGTIDQKMQTARTGAPTERHWQCLLTSTQRRIIRHRPVQISQPEQARHQPRRLPQRQAEQHLQRQAQFDRTVRKMNRTTRAATCADSHCISGSNHTSREPRCFSAALYALQFVMRYIGLAGLGIAAPYSTRFTQGIPKPNYATKPLSAPATIALMPIGSRIRRSRRALVLTRCRRRIGKFPRGADCRERAEHQYALSRSDFSPSSKISSSSKVLGTVMRYQATPNSRRINRLWGGHVSKRSG